MNRRRFLTLLGFVGSLAGCVGHLPFDKRKTSKPVSLRVRNYFDERRVVTVTINGKRGKQRYKSDFYLFPGWIANRRNILEAGAYEVNVQIDNGMWRKANWTMEGCDSNVILVDAGQDGVGITSTCQKEMTTTSRNDTASENETATGNEIATGNETAIGTGNGTPISRDGTDSENETSSS